MRRSGAAPARALALAALLLALVYTLPAASAAAADPVPAPATREQAREMVASLSDEEVRRILLQHLDRSLPQAQAAASARSPWLLGGVSIAIDGLRGLVARSGALADEVRRLAGNVAVGHDHPWLALLAAILVALAAGALL
jgi:hypothetical protein